MKIVNPVALPPNVVHHRQDISEVERLAAEKKETKQLVLPESQFSETTPDQVEAALVQARQARQSNNRNEQQAANQDNLSAFNQRALSAYQSHIEEEERAFVRSVVAGIDIFV